MRSILVLMVVTLLAGQAHAQAGRFDGNYGNPDGTLGSGSCATTRFVFRLAVSNGQASMRTATAGTLEGPVRADGTLDIQQGRTSLQGRIDGARFAGTLSFGNQCQFALNYKRF